MENKPISHFDTKINVLKLNFRTISNVQRIA